MTMVRILHCGPATSIQDQGRFGWLRFGIASSGASDPLALASANALVGNPAGCEAIELVFLGAALEVVGGSVRLALAGARMPLRLDGRTIASDTTFVMEPGCRLEIGAATAGIYAILAVEGGFDIPAVLGSKSLHRRAGLGGLNGQPLAAGSEIALNCQAPSTDQALTLAPLPLTADGPLRAVLGPQAQRVTQRGIDTFFGSAFTVSNAVDRMACRLDGPPIELTHGHNIVSDGIVAGSVQIPGSGQPIVMLADRQTTGGYPKLATIITPDLRYLVQCRPGETVRFQPVTVEAAEAAARAAAVALAQVPLRRRPVPRSPAHDDDLLALNLAGHASSACDPVTWQG